VINDRLTINKLTTTKIKRNKQTHKVNKVMKLVERTWEPALRKEKEIPENWMHCCEVLVGRTA